MAVFGPAAATDSENKSSDHITQDTATSEQSNQHLCWMKTGKQASFQTSAPLGPLNASVPQHSQLLSSAHSMKYFDNHSNLVHTLDRAARFQRTRSLFAQMEESWTYGGSRHSNSGFLQKENICLPSVDLYQRSTLQVLSPSRFVNGNTRKALMCRRSIPPMFSSLKPDFQQIIARSSQGIIPMHSNTSSNNFAQVTNQSMDVTPHDSDRELKTALPISSSWFQDTNASLSRLESSLRRRRSTTPPVVPAKPRSYRKSSIIETTPDEQATSSYGFPAGVDSNVQLIFRSCEDVNTPSDVVSNCYENQNGANRDSDSCRGVPDGVTMRSKRYSDCDNYDYNSALDNLNTIKVLLPKRRSREENSFTADEIETALSEAEDFWAKEEAQLRTVRGRTESEDMLDSFCSSGSGEDMFKEDSEPCKDLVEMEKQQIDWDGDDITKTQSPCDSSAEKSLTFPNYPCCPLISGATFPQNIVVHQVPSEDESPDENLAPGFPMEAVENGMNVECSKQFINDLDSLQRLDSKVKFREELIEVFPTYSADEYDRTNEDIDPMAASAEYELEKRVEKMDMFEVEIEKGGNGLGLGIIGIGVGADAGIQKLGIFVKMLTTGGAAELDQRIQLGDQIIEVDGQSLVGVTQMYAASVLRNTAGKVRLIMGREEDSENGEVVRLIKHSIELEKKQKEKEEQRKLAYEESLAAEVRDWEDTNQEDNDSVTDLLDTIDAGEDLERQMDKQLIFVKLKEVQYKNAVLEAEQVKLRAKMILMEKAESQKKFYEKKCEELSLRLRESEKRVQFQQSEIVQYQDAFEETQIRNAAVEGRLQARYNDLEKKYQKSKKLIKEYQQREKDYKSDRDAVYQQQTEKEQQFNDLVKSLKDRIFLLEKSLADACMTAGLLPSITRQPSAKDIVPTSTNLSLQRPKNFENVNKRRVSELSDFSDSSPDSSPDREDHSEVKIEYKQTIEAIARCQQATEKVDSASENSQDDEPFFGHDSDGTVRKNCKRKSVTQELQKRIRRNSFSNNGNQSEFPCKTRAIQSNDNSQARNDNQSECVRVNNFGQSCSFTSSHVTQQCDEEERVLRFQSTRSSRSDASSSDTQRSEVHHKEVHRSSSADVIQALEVEMLKHKQFLEKQMAPPNQVCLETTSDHCSYLLNKINEESRTGEKATNKCPENFEQILPLPTSYTLPDIAGSTIGTDLHDVMTGATTITVLTRDDSSVSSCWSSSRSKSRPYYGHVEGWTPDQVSDWLSKQDLQQHCQDFIANNVDGTQLLELDNAQMKVLGIKTSRDRDLLRKKLKDLRAALERQRKQEEREKKTVEKRNQTSTKRKILFCK